MSAESKAARRAKRVNRPAAEPQAAAFAFGEFAKPQAKTRTTEYGFTLIRDKAGLLSSGRLTISPSIESVNLYEDQAVLIDEVLCGFDDSGQPLADPDRSYFGDYHTHPVSEELLHQLPSPPDLGARHIGGNDERTPISVACDLWIIGADSPLDVAPKIQVIQSTLYGDLFVLTRAPGRHRFSTIAEQTAGVDVLIERYREVYYGAEPTLAKLGARPDRHVFRQAIYAILPNLRASIAERVDLKFLECPD